MRDKQFRFYMYYQKRIPRLLARLYYFDFGFEVTGRIRIVISPFRWRSYTSRAKYVTFRTIGPLRIVIHHRN